MFVWPRGIRRRPGRLLGANVPGLVPVVVLLGTGVLTGAALGTPTARDRTSSLAVAIPLAPPPNREIGSHGGDSPSHISVT